MTLKPAAFCHPCQGDRAVGGKGDEIPSSALGLSETGICNLDTPRRGDSEFSFSYVQGDAADGGELEPRKHRQMRGFNAPVKAVET